MTLRQTQKQGNKWCRRACASGNPQPGHCDGTWRTWVHNSPGALVMEAMVGIPTSTAVLAYLHHAFRSAIPKHSDLPKHADLP